MIGVAQNTDTYHLVYIAFDQKIMGANNLHSLQILIAN